jgi:hypothetical protein
MSLLEELLLLSISFPLLLYITITGAIKHTTLANKFTTVPIRGIQKVMVNRMKGVYVHMIYVYIHTHMNIYICIYIYIYIYI